MPTFGLEEEVFIVDSRRRISRQSLYYMARLLWSNPRRHYFNVASNMSRGSDVRQGIISCMETATGIHTDVRGLLEDHLSRRRELARLCDERLIAIGHLFDYHAPSNIAALHIHIGGIAHPQRTYNNLAYFLPLLHLLTMSSPQTSEGKFGHSFRIANGYAIGPLQDDPGYRFQDLIFARRLGTIEIRSFDAVWDPARLKYLLGAIDAIVSLDETCPFNRDEYNNLRGLVASEGWSSKTDKALRARLGRLSQIVDVPADVWHRTPADILCDLVEARGLDRVYSALDQAYRMSAELSLAELDGIGHKSLEDQLFSGAEAVAGGDTRLETAAPLHALSPPTRFLRTLVGIVGFYLPNLPYKIYKFRKEW